MLSQHLDRSKRMPQIPILLFADVSLCCFSNIFWWKEKVFWSVPSCLRRLQLLAVDTKTEHAGNTTLCYARPSRERCKDRVSYKTLLSSFGCQLFVIERLSDVLKTLTSVTLTRELWPVACSTFKMPKKVVDQSFSTSISPSADNENITARIRTRRNDTGKKGKISTIYLSMTLNIIGNNLTTIYLTV